MTMRRRFAVIDIDGTLIRWQLYHGIVEELARSGAIDQTRFRRVLRAREKWEQRTSDDAYKMYERELVIVYLSALSSISEDQYLQAIEHTFQKHKDRVYTYTRSLIRDLKAKNYALFAISGSHNEAVELIANYYGFDDAVGVKFPRVNGKFTGRMIETWGVKHEILEALIKKHHVSMEQSIAVGDSEGDITMLESVKKPIVFNPTKKLFHHAQKHHWRVVLERKNVIYTLEPSSNGYRLDSVND